MSEILRVTARHFQKRFQRLEEPTLVNDGIYFPRLTDELRRIAERYIKQARESE